MDKIIIRGARENNLKNVSLELPKNKLIVMTGVSGSGKSSLAFDTIYQEGQRRYVESLSAYARQFLGGSEKPDVDFIEGLSPAISIDQKTTSNNPRSTVGTVTEIYDYLRLLYARVGVPYCPTHKEPIKSQTIDEMISKILKLEEKTKIQILAPIINNQRGSFKGVIDAYIKQGFVKAKIDGEIVDLTLDLTLDKNKKHTVLIVIDRLVIKPDINQRLTDSLETGLKFGNGKVIVDVIGKEEILFSEKYACKYCDFSMPHLEPSMFSFNSPIGACPDCGGLGFKQVISQDLTIDYDKSVNEACFIPLKNQAEDNIQNSMIKQTCEYYGIDLDKPFKDLTNEQQKILCYGSDDLINYHIVSSSGRITDKKEVFEGVLTNLQRRFFETQSSWIHDWLSNYMVEDVCPTCGGKRLRNDLLNVFINGLNINDVTNLSIKELKDFILNLELDEENKKIASIITNEILSRLDFLNSVGLDYLTLSRRAGSLSGGEAQRIRLATQIGSRLTGVLYVLDEPSIGLHQRDNGRLIKSLKEMRDLGNTLIVVEHDEEMMLESDYLVDIGPKAGIHGGEIVAKGTPKEVMENPNSLTGLYLSKKLKLDVPKTRRKSDKFLEVIEANKNNLKNITVKIPIGVMTVVTGVSGSGKSSLVNEVIYNAVHNNIYKPRKIEKNYKKINNLDYFDKVIDISQSPIGRTPRSNPATYTGVFDDIRDLFASTNDAKVRGYDKGRFSFNVKGGRCEACWGDGVKRIQMQFLPDVYVPCSVCNGSRYNKETLEVKYKGKSINDVLNMTIEDACEFFKNIPKIYNKLNVLFEVGLGYLKLGQPATLLSGGEAQRVKLASELYKKITEKTLYILDEPTTGLHIDDIKKLMAVLNKIVDKKATMIIIEHNLDVIKMADYIIDLGPEGGNNGGQIIATGTPEEVAKCDKSYTGQYLKKYLK